MPGQSDPRLNVVVVAAAKGARGMNQAAPPSRKRVDGLGIKIRLLAVLRGKRALVRVPDAQIERQGRRELPVVLKIKGVGSRARIPACQSPGELGLAHITQKEPREAVAGA